MVVEAIKRELLSMESVVSFAAIAVALPAVWLGGQLETMQSGFPLMFTAAIYPSMYVRESDRSIGSVPIGVLYGASMGAVIFIGFLLCYRVVVRLWESGIHAEAIAFLVVSVIVFGGAALDKRHLNTESGAE